MTRDEYNRHRQNIISKRRQLTATIRANGHATKPANIERAKRSQAALDVLEPTPPKLPRVLAYRLYDADGDFMGTSPDIADAKACRLEGGKVEAVDYIYAGSWQV